MSDDEDKDANGRTSPPSVSRIGRGEPRRYRTLSRVRSRGRFPREGQPLPLGELVGRLIEQHGLTDACRQQLVCIYWNEIVGERFAPRTWPVRLTDGVLHVETESSSWLHELQFHKATLVAKINAWVDASEIRLAPPPLVAEMRFELGGRRRKTPIAEREHVRRMKARQVRRLWRPRTFVPPIVTEAEREAIRAEASAILDPELRGIVESLRVKWNR